MVTVMLRSRHCHVLREREKSRQRKIYLPWKTRWEKELILFIYFALGEPMVLGSHGLYQ